MDQGLRDARLEHCAQAFVDDLLIYSQDFESHVQHVEAVLAAFQAAGLRAILARVCSARTKWKYLGHVITPSGIEPQAAKVQAMTQLPAPIQCQPIAVCLRAAQLLQVLPAWVCQYGSTLIQAAAEVCRF
jgi:hypothetical protein